MKNHSYHSELADIGNADLTAHVDFMALEAVARAEGMNVHQTIPQGQFLMRLGAGARTTTLCERANAEQQKLLLSGLKRLADPKEMGELFKVLAITSKQIEKADGF
jgi:NADH dehydrogenase [ubiquinone] 1 alpha subcomplex assembly factor 7